MSSRSGKYHQSNNSKSNEEPNKNYQNIEIKPKLHYRSNLPKHVKSSPQFASLVEKPSENIEDIASMILVDISEKNSEKMRNKIKDEEKYEQDIRALKKRLDFLNSSNVKLIESSLKKNNLRTITKDVKDEDEHRRQSDYIYTERHSNADVSPNTSSGPDIMQYVSEETFSKSKFTDFHRI